MGIVWVGFADWFDQTNLVGTVWWKDASECTRRRVGADWAGGILSKLRSRNKALFGHSTGRWIGVEMGSG